MSQLNITINDDLKSKWKEAVAKNPEYNSLTHLVTLSVTKELSDDEATESSLSSGEDVMSIMDSIEDLREDLSEAHTDIQDVRLTVNGLETSQQVRTDILECLSNWDRREDAFQSAAEMWEDYDGDLSDGEMIPEPEGDLDLGMTSDDISVETGIELPVVERELEWLVHNQPSVERYRADGETYYVRTDQP